MGTDGKENAKQVVDFIILQLKQISSNFECYNQPATILGSGFEKATRPWAFLFCKDDQHIKHVLKEKAIALFQGQLDSEERKWLDSIQICRVDTVHQLKAIMCAIHLKPNSVKSNHLLSWLEEEKYGQPPSLMIVVDLMDLILDTKNITDPLRYNRLK
ncbi:hypothetical protein K501DRAFT_253618 [Backusella circina FSU 941]|nr:hypothetical protein K501DRAFT_253618 [Backusella circina FSU 941]